jgi:cellulose synthase/poly-beta-1,6-N-acetylglucosamine synthase-like glycosyltransferase
MSLVQTLSQDLLWLCAGLVLYTYLGYPALIWLLSRLFGRRHADYVRADQDLPSISLLIVAYNEEAVIDGRIRNALAMDYPAGKLEIVVASDGSSDATTTLVGKYAEQGVRLLDFPQRRGKAAVINASLPELHGELVLMSDANTSIDPAAARRLAQRFGDPAVGVVCGQLVFNSPQGGSNVDNLYWSYETFLKKAEARLHALLGANGAIYAFRRQLFVPIPDDTIVDDLVVPLLAKQHSGCVLAFADEALAWEDPAASLGQEFRRRMRLGMGGFQSFGPLWRYLDPRSGWSALSFWSHKALRWLCPFFLLGMLVTSALLADRAFYRNLFLGQAAFYGFSLLVPLLVSRVRWLRFLLLTTMFTGMNAALLVGFWRWLSRKQRGIWEPTPRQAELTGTSR